MTIESGSRGNHHLGTLGAMLDARRGEMAEAITDRVLDDLPAEWAVQRPELSGQMQEAVRASLTAELEAFRENLAVPETCPPADAYQAQLAAEMGAGLEHLHWALRVGHQQQWRLCSEMVEGLEASEAERGQLRDRTSDFFFEYANRLWAFVNEEYSVHRERVLRGSDQRRAQIVHEILAGQDADLTGLDYEIDAFHLAVITWGPRASQVAQDLAGRTGRNLLLVPLARSTIYWSWLGGSRPFDQGAGMLDSFQPSRGTAAALGEEEAGLAGFRRSHRLASYAHRAGRASGAAITRYRDIAIEALSGRDEPEARAFVARELAGLDGDDKRSRALRKTLATYFECGHNAAATAASLGVHEQTVANRLNAVAEVVGSDVNARRCELETALRLRTFLADRGA